MMKGIGKACSRTELHRETLLKKIKNKRRKKTQVDILPLQCLFSTSQSYISIQHPFGDVFNLCIKLLNHME